MPDNPSAFLTYARADDEYEGGKISEFRHRLREAYRAVTGDELDVFQDRDSIEWGEHWPKALDKTLAGTTFLIPILSPRFFASRHCRDEVDKFLKHEQASGRDDLVLPVYWIKCRLLDNPLAHPADDAARLAKVLHQRQRKDWRQLRFHDFNERLVREALEAMAEEIERAVHRHVPIDHSDNGSAEEEDTWNRAATLAKRPDTAPDIAGLPDLSVFRDRPDTPEMVILPSGSFMMGSPEGEGFDPEHPQHRVNISYRLAVGRYPVARSEFAMFVQATGRTMPDECYTYEGGAWELRKGRSWRNPGFDQGDDHPVVGVNWEDAQGYVRWLSETTGQTYRLLSEAEWEYAARAGTTTRYWWGDEISLDKANYGAVQDIGPKKTTPVGSYAANPWKLFDVHGNVWEWVEDCWNASYQGAPADGSARTAGDCSRRVLRGGSWRYIPVNLRAAIRSRYIPGDRSGSVGFRVARTLR